MLRAYSTQIFDSSDPSNVLFQRESYDLVETNDSIAVRVRVLLVKEADVNVMKDDDLIITARHDAGFVANIITLPLAAMRMKLYSCGLNGDELSIVLVR